MNRQPPIFSFFFFNDTATTEIYTLSLHDALPISDTCFLNQHPLERPFHFHAARALEQNCIPRAQDRKSTRLNSSHQIISYAVFCLKKKKKPHVISDVTTMARPRT